QSRDRAIMLGRLVPGHKGCAGAPQHPPLPAGAGLRPGALSRRAALRGATVRSRRCPTVLAATWGAGAGPGDITTGERPRPGGTARVRGNLVSAGWRLAAFVAACCIGIFA